MSNTPPLGYVFDGNALNPQDVYLKHQMSDKAVTVTKAAIQNYIDSFLNPNGVNRGYIATSSSPVGLQFVTELTYDDEMKADPNLRKVYLARFFAENVGRLPSVLIIDSGVEYIDTGINDLTFAKYHADGIWEGHLTSQLKITLSVTTATLSEEDTDTLSMILTTIFGPLPAVVNGFILSQPDARWEVRLPMSGIALGQGSSIAIEGDTKTSVWTRALDFTCEFETHIVMKLPSQKVELPVEVSVNLLPKFLNLAEDQELPLGYPYPLFIDFMRPDYTLRVSDPTIATVSMSPPWVLSPRKQGRALLLVITPTGEPLAVSENPSHLILDIPFRVTRF